MKTTQRIDWIVDRITGDLILDVGYTSLGVDDGLLHKKIVARTKALVVGIDTDQKNAKKMHLANTIVGDMFYLPFKTNSFDSIVIGEVFEHLSAIEMATGELIRVCKKNGIILVTTPSSFALFRYLRNWLLTENPGQKQNVSMYLGSPNHVVYWDGLSLCNLFAKLGAPAVEVTSRNLSLPYMPTFLREPPLNFWPFNRLGTYFCARFIKQ